MEKVSDDIKHIIECLKKDNPGWQISWGYIGNIWQSPYIDDRHWRISMRPEGIMTSLESEDSYSVGHVANKEDRSIVFMLNDDKFYAWVMNQKIRWHEYMIANFKNKMEGKTEKEVFMNMMERMGYYGKSRCYSDETYFYELTRNNCYGKRDEYTYAKFEAAFDTTGNLIDIRAST